MLRYPLIHQRDSTDWQAWFANARVPWIPQATGVVIEDANVVLRSCIEGQGIALGWPPLISPDLESGRLVKLFDLAVSGPRAYYLCQPSPKPRVPLIDQVTEWLVAQAT